MSVKKVVKGGVEQFYVKRIIKGEIHEQYFSNTKTGEKKALLLDRRLSILQKQSSPKKNTYLCSKYGFLRGLSITYQIENGKFIPRLCYLMSVNNTYYVRMLEVRCGRSFRGCFDEMVDDILKILKVSKHVKNQLWFKKMISETYEYCKAKDKANRDKTAPKPKKKSRKGKK